jgi:hypothetical protein
VAAFRIPKERAKDVRVGANRRTCATVLGPLLRDGAIDPRESDLSQRLGIRTISTNEFFDSETPCIHGEQRQTSLYSHVIQEFRHQCRTGRFRGGFLVNPPQKPEPAKGGGHERRLRPLAMRVGVIPGSSQGPSIRSGSDLLQVKRPRFLQVHHVTERSLIEGDPLQGCGRCTLSLTEIEVPKSGLKERR